MIPLHRPFVAPRQPEYLLDAMSRSITQGDGYYGQLATRRLMECCGVEQLLLTPSASHGLELAFWQLEPEGEIILPAYNFPSAGNAVLRGGGKVILCDVDPHTQNLCPQQAEALITPHTRGICLTHYAGIACHMDAFEELARRYHLLLLEDAAHAIGSSHRGRPLGSIGDGGCLSFHGTKNIGCGEGGAYLQKADSSLFSQMRTRREKGTNRHEFLAGSARFYSWQEVGSSLLMPELSAAVLLAQLEELEAVTACRLGLCRSYDRQLQPLFDSGRLCPMVCPEYAEGNGHIYYILASSREERDHIQHFLRQREIMATSHFVPLHLGGMGARLGYHPGDFPVSEKTADTLLRLPLFYGMEDSQVDEVCQAVTEALS